jgi:chromosome segregation ATPase
LKNLFCEHFRVDSYQCLENCPLDFETFNVLLLKWTHLLHNNNNNNHNQNKINHKESLDEANNCSSNRRRLSINTAQNYFHHKKKLLSMNIINNSVSPSCSSSSSIPSAASLSDDDQQNCNKCRPIEIEIENRDEVVEIGSYEEDSDHALDDEVSILIESSASELKYENSKLRELNTDLKTQLQNAEEMNAQLAHDLEISTQNYLELQSNLKEVHFRYEFLNDENEHLKKLSEQLKHENDSLKQENSSLDFSLKKATNKLDMNENELYLLQFQINSDKRKLEKLELELHEQKCLARDIQKLNACFEQQLIDV